MPHYYWFVVPLLQSAILLVARITELENVVSKIYIIQSGLFIKKKKDFKIPDSVCCIQQKFPSPLQFWVKYFPKELTEKFLSGSRPAALSLDLLPTAALDIKAVKDFFEMKPIAPTIVAIK